MNETLAIAEFAEILGNVKYKDWHFYVGQDGDRVYLQVQFEEQDFVTGHSGIQKGRKWLLSPYMTKSEVVATAFKAALTAEEHEARESFRYKGKMIFGPHIDVDALASIVGKKENLDMRTGRWV
jgi:hypothetical protein